MKIRYQVFIYCVFITYALIGFKIGKAEASAPATAQLTVFLNDGSKNQAKHDDGDGKGCFLLTLACSAADTLVQGKTYSNSRCKYGVSNIAEVIIIVTGEGLAHIEETLIRSPSGGYYTITLPNLPAGKELCFQGIAKTATDEIVCQGSTTATLEADKITTLVLTLACNLDDDIYLPVVALKSAKNQILPDEATTIEITINDEDSEKVWVEIDHTASEGTLSNIGGLVTLIDHSIKMETTLTAGTSGEYSDTVTVTVDDQSGGITIISMEIEILNFIPPEGSIEGSINIAPMIESLIVNDNNDGTMTITAKVSDEKEDSLIFHWGGDIAIISDCTINPITIETPLMPSTLATLEVTDELGSTTSTNFYISPNNIDNGDISENGCEYVIENFNDIITLNDTGFNDFSGNMGLLNKNGIPYIAAPLKIDPNSSLDGPGGSLKISWDFTLGDDDPEAFTGVFMSLFGLTDTQGTFDGINVETIDFSNFSIDFNNIFGELNEEPKSFDKLCFWVKGDKINNDNTITLRIELKDNTGTAAYYRVTISGEEWKEVTIPICDFQGIHNVNSGKMKVLSFIIERNHVADSIHNENKGTFFLDTIRFLDLDSPPLNFNQLSDDEFLHLVSKRAFQYFLDWTSKDSRSANFVQDRSTFGDLLSVGGIGFWLSAMPIGIQNGWINREVAANKVAETLAILADDSLQGPEQIGKIGYKGFFYHFLGIDGKRKINFDFLETSDRNESLNTVELSIIDTVLCIYGALVCREYFNGAGQNEVDIRNYADYIFERVEWSFMVEPNSGQFYWGWKPNEQRDSAPPFEIPDGDGLGSFSGIPDNPTTIDVYTDEAYLISLLSIASPTHPLPADIWCSWQRDTDGGSFVKSYPGTLFTYFFANLWINQKLWGKDACSQSFNWFENSRKAIITSRDYCIDNSSSYLTYADNLWGLTACEGPDDNYRAYGSPLCALNMNTNVEEDGTLAPYGAASCISFGDEIAGYSIQALREFCQNQELWHNRFGLADAYNLDVSKVPGINGDNIIRNSGRWYNHVGFAIDNGPLLMAIENYRSGLIWNLIGQNQHIRYALHQVYSRYSTECEYPDESTVGQTIWRSNASASKVHGQFGCESNIPWGAKTGYVQYSFNNLPEMNNLFLILRYSKHSPSLASLEIYLDDEAQPRASLIPENQGDWNTFIETSIALGEITAGMHTVKLMTVGQQYGVADLDKITCTSISR